MTIYQSFWEFSTQEASVKCTEAFVEYLTEGEQANKFDGFEIKCRVMDPHNGTGNFVVKADGPQKNGSIPHNGLGVLGSKLK